MKKWPILKIYQGEFLRRIARPLGGIGSGTVSVGERGTLQDSQTLHISFRDEGSYEPNL